MQGAAGEAAVGEHYDLGMTRRTVPGIAGSTARDWPTGCLSLAQGMLAWRRLALHLRAVHKPDAGQGRTDRRIL